MVIRYYCRCLTCGFAHTLRIAMGHGPTQHHTFQCGSCGQDMTIDVVQRPEVASADIQFTNNCEIGTEEGLIVNLHPDFPVPKDQLHVDRAFPWLKHVSAVGQQQDALGLRGTQPGSETSIEEWAAKIQTHPQQWAIVNKAWSLERGGRLELSKNERRKYLSPDILPDSNLNDVLFDFCARLLQANTSWYMDAFAVMNDAWQRTPALVNDFRAWYAANLLEEHRERYFDILAQFFRDHGEFSQALLLVQYKLPISSDEVASSQAFSRTKMFYGNAFEALTSNFAVLACINNIYRGRSFDQFASMDLKKYLTINKARRAEPFADTPAFAAFATGLNSSLRNASHHGAIKLALGQRQISFRSGGTGAEQKLGYVEYLAQCSDILLRLVTLLMLEIALMR